MFLFFRLFAGGFFFVFRLRLTAISVSPIGKHRRIGASVAYISNENCEQGPGQTSTDATMLYIGSLITPHSAGKPTRP
jgi:hypothetical protein